MTLPSLFRPMRSTSDLSNLSLYFAFFEFAYSSTQVGRLWLSPVFGLTLAAQADRTESGGGVYV